MTSMSCFEVIKSRIFLALSTSIMRFLWLKDMDFMNISCYYLHNITIYICQYPDKDLITFSDKCLVMSAFNHRS